MPFLSYRGNWIGQSPYEKKTETDERQYRQSPYEKKNPYERQDRQTYRQTMMYRQNIG